MLYFFQPVVCSSWFAINSEFWPINLLFLGCSLSEFLPVYSLATDQYSPGTEDTYLPLDWVLFFWLSCPPPWKFILLSLVSVLHAALSPQTAAPPLGTSSWLFHTQLHCLPWSIKEHLRSLHTHVNWLPVYKYICGRCISHLKGFEKGFFNLHQTFGLKAELSMEMGLRDMYA